MSTLPNESRIPREEPKVIRVAAEPVREREFDSDAMDLRNLLNTLWRRKGVILSSVFLVTLVTIITVFQLTPRYTAETKLIIDTRKTNVVDIEQVLGGLSGDLEVVQSEIEIITSRELIRKVADKLNLVDKPEFNATLRPPSFTSELNPLRWLPVEWRTALTGKTSAPVAATEAERESRIREGVVGTLLRKISVDPVGRSRVLRLSATSENPKLAADIANTLANLYLVDQLEAKFEATRRATGWLNERVQDLREQVETSERAVEVYRTQAGLTKGGKDTTLTAQQISEINTQLILARARSAEAGARLRQVESLLKSPNGVDSAAEVLASPLIQSLRGQEALVQRREAEMATEYGPRHPKMINVKAEIRDLQAKIKTEVEKIVRNLRNELSVARARERTLEQDLEKLKQEVGILDTASVQLRALEREAEANKALFKTFLERMKETGEQDEIQQPDARIISKAVIPGGPSFPNKNRFIGMGMALSVFVGILLVFLIERLDPGFRSSDQIEQMLGVRTLALNPLLAGLKRIRARPEDYVVDKPASAFAESLRTLYTGVLLSDVDAQPKVILLASSLPREGKTTMAISLARLIAGTGKKVLLIDADIRKRQAGKMLKLNNEPGLVDLLSSRKAILPKEVIQSDDQSSLHFLAPGTAAPSPPDLFGSMRMQMVMEELRKTYDLIVVDSPPTLVVSDAQVLAHVVDKTVFLIRWARTRREVAQAGLKTLRESGADVAGVVLTQVNVRRHSQYDYGDSGYYYGSVRRYYAD